MITIAGILDTASYTYQNNLPEMKDAENPANNLAALSQITQIHYVGSQDQITPIKVAERFVRKMDNPKSAVVKVVPDVDHTNWEGVTLDDSLQKCLESGYIEGTEAWKRAYDSRRFAAYRPAGKEA